jgi:hypothetical protein
MICNWRLLLRTFNQNDLLRLKEIIIALENRMMVSPLFESIIIIRILAANVGVYGSIFAIVSDQIMMHQTKFEILEPATTAVPSMNQPAFPQGPSSIVDDQD